MQTKLIRTRAITPSLRLTSPRPFTTSAIMAAKDPIVEALKEFTTCVHIVLFTYTSVSDRSSCDVSDALQKLKDPEARNGGFLSGLSNWSPTRQQEDTKIVGPLYTVKYSPLDDPAPKLAKHYVRPFHSAESTSSTDG